MAFESYLGSIVLSNAFCIKYLGYLWRVIRNNAVL